MKNLKYTGMVIFLIGLAIFTTTPFLGNVKMTEAVMLETLDEQKLGNLEVQLREQLLDKEFSSAFAFSRAFIGIYEAKNEELKANKEWGQVMHTKSASVALDLSRASNNGIVTQNKWLFFFLTFGLGIIGALFYIIVDLKLKGPPGIKNDGIYHDTATNRGWIGVLTAVWLVTFYIVLYFHPYIMTDAISLTDPVKGLFKEGAMASQWFLYGLLYCTSMLVMGVRMYIKYRHNKYQIVRTTSVLFFQVIFAFLLVEILPLFGLPGRDLKNAMPLDYTFLYKYNIQELLDAGQFGMFLIIWGFVLSIIVVPTLVYFYGKRWYCSWVCGCGGLAETLGDPYRQLSNKKLWAWKLERWLVHGVLVFAAILTVFVGIHTFTSLGGVNDGEGVSTIMGISAFDVRDWYGFMVGAVFAGVIGTGFYPLFGNRTWCRFGCPLAAYMGLVQRFKSRFRITTNGGQCISCGNCSTYCEQGIDVRAYAQKGQNIIRSSCVGCGVCSAVCPRGVLKLENGPEAGRFGNEGPIVLGNDGFQLNQ
ncbi:MAG: 4Fe-4S binding protein [Crocinitomix sp.]|nr:4Fe-4S binding protein [Crocinitomix sp.]